MRAPRRDTRSRHARRPTARCRHHWRRHGRRRAPALRAPGGAGRTRARGPARHRWAVARAAGLAGHPDQHGRLGHRRAAAGRAAAAADPGQHRGLGRSLRAGRRHPPGQPRAPCPTWRRRLGAGHAAGPGACAPPGGGQRWPQHAADPARAARRQPRARMARQRAARRAGAGRPRRAGGRRGGLRLRPDRSVPAARCAAADVGLSRWRALVHADDPAQGHRRQRAALRQDAGQRHERSATERRDRGGHDRALPASSACRRSSPTQRRTCCRTS